MLSTGGYVYLRIDDPLCAWNTYRGVLVSADVIGNERGWLSTWVAAMIRNRGPGSTAVARECRLEQHRRSRYPNKVSRSYGIYTFRNKATAERARVEVRLPYMTAESLAEISLAQAKRISIHDANWITYRTDDPDESWMDAYWKGEPCPDADPLWEQLVSGRVIVLGTQLREQAYEIIRRRFPESLCLLEIARIAAWIESDLGTIAAYLIQRGNGIAMEYLFNMVDAKDPDFLRRLDEYIKSGQPVNRADIDPHFKNDSFGAVPDFREFSLVKPVNEVSYLAYLL